MDTQPAVWKAKEPQGLAVVMANSPTAEEGSSHQTKWFASQDSLPREGKVEASGLGRNHTESWGHLSLELCPSYIKGYDSSDL